MKANTTRWRQAAAALLLMAVVSCNDDSSDDLNAQPAPNQTVFTNGEFDEIPVFRGATLVHGPSTKEGTTTASFETEQGASETALRFYEENLPALGWSVADPVVETSRGVWRGDWIRDGRRLQVIASDLSPSSGDATHTQINLVLLADTGDVPVATVAG